MKEKTYRILAEGHLMSNDTRETGLNNNDAVIGPSGSGKTRGYVMPNILQCSGSMIAADTKGRLSGELGSILKREGYKVINMDFTDCLSSYGYNPLDFIRYDRGRGRHREQDIMCAAACLIPQENRHDPFWEQAARMVLECLISYTLECLPEDEQAPDSLVRLFMEMGTGKFDRLLTELEGLDPGSFAVMRYRMFTSMARADRMYASVQGVLAQKLSALAFDGACAMYHRRERIRFADLGKEKTAVFLNISDTDRSMDGLVRLFYAQAFRMLCACADGCPGHALSVPVHIILDDFAANVRIPDFDRIISVIRSRGISAALILQSISQLEGMYGRARAATILNNCDNCLYLGGQDVDTAKYVSIRANKPASAILEMPIDGAWLFTRGRAAEKVRKYDIRKHERYACLKEAHAADSGEGDGKGKWI